MRSLDSGGGSGSTVFVVADWEYNTREIPRVAMGVWSVIDTMVATPNRYLCLLVPPCGNDGSGAGGDLISGKGKFVCTEYVRQIVSKPRSNNGRDNLNLMVLTVSPLSVKEIKTISMYDVDNEDQITCQQSTVMYLVPSQTNPIAFKRWQLSRGRAVDVRHYDVTYTQVV